MCMAITVSQAKSVVVSEDYGSPFVPPLGTLTATFQVFMAMVRCQSGKCKHGSASIRWFHIVLLFTPVVTVALTIITVAAQYVTAVLLMQWSVHAPIHLVCSKPQLWFWVPRVHCCQQRCTVDIPLSMYHVFGYFSLRIWQSKAQLLIKMAIHFMPFQCGIAAVSVNSRTPKRHFICFLKYSSDTPVFNNWYCNRYCWSSMLCWTW